MSFQSAVSIKYSDYIFKLNYKIDKDGNVYSPWRGWKKMYQHQNKQGYKELYLYLIDGTRKCFKVHRLMMNTFYPIPNSEQFQVNHKDGIKNNNSLTNLEWCTRSQNLKHAFLVGLEKRPQGELNSNHKLTKKEVDEICKKILQRKYSLQDIACQYKVTKGTISHIKNKRIWKNITSQYNFN